MNHEKNEGQKSHDTLPLSCFFSSEFNITEVSAAPHTLHSEVIFTTEKLTICQPTIGRKYKF